MQGAEDAQLVVGEAVVPVQVQQGKGGFLGGLLFALHGRRRGLRTEAAGLLHLDVPDLVGKSGGVVAQDVPDVGDEPRAVPDEQVAPLTAGVAHEPGQGEDVPALVQGTVGGDERAAALLAGASRTTVARQRPLMIRLRTGKWLPICSVPGGYSERITPRTARSS